MSSRGASLLEIITVIGITSILIVVVVTAFGDSLNTYNRQRRETRLGSELRSALLELTETVRQGVSLKAESEPAGFTLGQYTLIAQLPPVTCDGEVIRNLDIPHPNKDQFIYYLDETDESNPKLVKKIIPAAAWPASPEPEQFAASCRTAEVVVVAEQVFNKVWSAPIFLDSSGAAATIDTKSILIDLLLQDDYRTSTIQVRSNTLTTLRNFGL